VLVVGTAPAPAVLGEEFFIASPASHSDFPITFRALGLQRDDRQIDVLLSSVTGDDLLQNAVVFSNVRAMVEKLAELSREDRDNLEINRRYSGLYLVLNDLLIHTQEELVRKIDGEYKPRLGEIGKEAEALRTMYSRALWYPVTGATPSSCWRARRLVTRGFLPLRFTRKDVYAHQVVPDVLRALERWGVSKSDTKAATSTECV